MKHLKSFNEAIREVSLIDFGYNPIGLYDLGYGGLFILAELKKKCPNTDFIFLGDNLTAKTATLTESDVVHLTSLGLSKLNELGCKTNIIACNTACALWPSFNQSTIDIISPTINWVRKLSPKNLGILATEKTIASGVYQSALNYKADQACPEWAQLVERNEITTVECFHIVKNDLEQLFNQSPDIDTILLACTHYVALEDIILKLYPEVKLISQGEIIADYILSKNIQSSRGGTCKYYTTGDTLEFDFQLSNLFHMNGNSIKIEL
jgi:glutamate racemase